MPQEFGTPGWEQPRDNRKGRQIPEASLRNHDGGEAAGTPREIVGKRSEKHHTLSAQSTFQRSWREAQRLFKQQKEHPDADTDDVVITLAEIEALRGNAPAVRELGAFLDANTDSNFRPNYLAVYLKASLLDDEIATNTIHTLLQTEKETRMLVDDENEDSPRRSYGVALTRIVQACAEEQVPADEWIDRYAIDPDEKADMQLTYLGRTKSQSHADAETIDRYSEDLANQFLEGTFTPKFAWNKVVDIYDLQKDDDQKKLIFSRFVDLFTGQRDAQMTYSMGMIDRFCQLGERYLEEGHSSAKEATWIEQKMHFMNEFADSEHYPSQRDDLTRPLKISLERFHDPTPQRIIEKLDLLMGEKSSNVGYNESARKYIVGERDEILWEYATRAMQKGALADAKEYITALGSDTSTASYRAFFDLIATPQDLAAVKPDELTLLYQEDLRKLFNATDVFLHGDSEEIAALTNSLLEERKPDLQTGGVLFPFLDGELFLKGIQMLYEQDKETAQQVTSGMIREIRSLINEKGTRSNKILKRIATIQIEHGDDNGWELLSEQAEDNYPSKRLHQHAQLALRAARAMQQEGIQIQQ